jgi:mono/diheme cytochrome c family protein
VRVPVKCCFIVVLLMLGACGAPVTSIPTPFRGDVEAGELKFLITCVACHGADAKGLPHLGKNLTTSAFVRGLTDGKLVAFIKRGRPPKDPLNTTGVEMPPKGNNPKLTDADLYDIVAYIRTLNH